MKPTTVDEYIASFPSEQSEKLAELRRVIKTALPDVSEELKWGNPAFVANDGMILAIMVGYKQHMNLVVTPSTKQVFESELVDYETGKGSVRFAYDKPLPVRLIERILEYRADEYRQQGVKWK